ncbi:N-acetyl-D-Glu racemase DgcA [Phytohalomonas tamaricis]|uniref:N-acetyl-D-Glu racemase DgcA n=1 Tax=Phytohalomonas tamaricis TaxID=2081032 RepID=UPI000D0B1CE9|nr:N-acetyl-D-Glu racemase DgcA [Phytohalomonas tamaricis]
MTPTRHFERLVQTWPLERPFVIARGVSTSIDVVQVRITQDGHVGIGECKPTPRYGHSIDTILAELDAIAAEIEQGLDRQALQQRLPAGPARNAVDCALWMLEARISGRTIWQQLSLDPNCEIVTAHTIGIASPAEMAAAATQALAAGARLLKVKLDNEQIIERVTAVRDTAPKTRIIIDANEAWRADSVAAHCAALAKLNVEMIEQPLPAGEDAILADFAHPVPLCADESCHTCADLERLATRYEMINIKLDKCGGITEGLAMIEESRRLGLELMVGCMLGTSVAMRAALPLAAQARIVDLDGPLWLARDVEDALDFSAGSVKDPGTRDMSHG